MKNIMLFIWQLPQNIVGLSFLLFFKLFDNKTLMKVKYQDDIVIYYAKQMSGGISLGRYIFLNSRYEEDKYGYELNTRKHEYGHTKQSKYLGWLYLLVIGIPSLLNAGFRFTDDYYEFYTEKWADKLGEVVRD